MVLLFLELSVLRQKENVRLTKLAWIITHDPRLSKNEMIKVNLQILHGNPTNEYIFAKQKLIAAEKRRKNLGEIYKPTIIYIRIEADSNEEKGFVTCQKKCAMVQNFR